MVDADCITQHVTKQYDGECDEENGLQDYIMESIVLQLLFVLELGVKGCTCKCNGSTDDGLPRQYVPKEHDRGSNDDDSLDHIAHAVRHRVYPCKRVECKPKHKKFEGKKMGMEGVNNQSRKTDEGFFWCEKTYWL